MNFLACGGVGVGDMSLVVEMGVFEGVGVAGMCVFVRMGVAIMCVFVGVCVAGISVCVGVSVASMCEDVGAAGMCVSVGVAGMCVSVGVSTYVGVGVAGICVGVGVTGMYVSMAMVVTGMFVGVTGGCVPVCVFVGVDVDGMCVSVCVGVVVGVTSMCVSLGVSVVGIYVSVEVVGVRVSGGGSVFGMKLFVSAMTGLRDSILGCFILCSSTGTLARLSLARELLASALSIISSALGLIVN